MAFDANGKEQPCGGKIPVGERKAYLTYTDKAGRTNAGVLVANYPVASEIKKEIFPPHNGFVTANIDVVYTLNDIPVMTRQCQIMMRPDRSEATIQNSEQFFAAMDLGRHKFEMATITREQFEVLKELFEQ